jgi:hypothetical protein
MRKEISSKKHKLRPLPDGFPCPCGSMIPYAKCCKSKAFKYQLNSKNEVIRSVRIHPKLKPLLLRQKREFNKLFGRKPGKDDRVFFQDFQKSPEQMGEDLREAALSAGIEPAKVYAMWKTGLIVTSDRLNLFTDLELDEYRSAAEEYDDLTAQGIDPFEPESPLSESQGRKLVELLQQVARAPVMLARIVDRGVKRIVKESEFFK